MMAYLLLMTTVIVASPEHWAHQQLQKHHPVWKVPIFEKMVKGKYYPLDVSITRYSDSDNLDPGTGGGNTCWWNKHDVKLRWGMIAASKYWARGTVFYTPQLKMFWVVTDRGPKVYQKYHFDIYCPDRETWNLVYKMTSKKVRAYKVGFVAQEEYCGGQGK